MRTMKTGDLCQLAAELTLEHGPLALEYARRATWQLECEGALDRARVWHALAVLLDDIAERRIDPDIPIVFH